MMTTNHYCVYAINQLKTTIMSITTANIYNITNSLIKVIS